MAGRNGRERWISALGRAWLPIGGLTGPDLDEFADGERVRAALTRPGAERSLLAVQHPHRTPAALRGGLSLRRALPAARAALTIRKATHYRPHVDALPLYRVSGPDGTAAGMLAVVDPLAVDGLGRRRVRPTEDVYTDVVTERAEVLAGLRCATSAALLIPMGEAGLAALVDEAIAGLGAPVTTNVDRDGRVHQVWLAHADSLPGLLAAASRHDLLAADGNHRLAAAVEAGMGMLALITDGPRLRIGPINRLLTGVAGGLTRAAMSTAWRAEGLLVRDADPGESPTPGMVLARCADGVVAVRLPEPGPTEPLPRVDHQVVERLLLPALGIDPRGEQVRPLPGPLTPAFGVPSGADGVLLISPVAREDLLEVHRQGRRMPRKATYFTPKPRSGLVLADLG